MVGDAYFSIDGRDVIMFRSRGSAQAFLETYDVGPGRDSIFRSDGTALRLEVSDSRVVVTDEVVAQDPSSLAETLRRFLLEVPRPRLMSPDQIRTATLSQLVQEFTRTEKAW
jgi:hypothetical protein